MCLISLITILGNVIVYSRHQVSTRKFLSYLIVQEYNDTKRFVSLYYLRISYKIEAQSCHRNFHLKISKYQIFKKKKKFFAPKMEP